MGRNKLIGRGVVLFLATVLSVLISGCSADQQLNDNPDNQAGKTAETTSTGGSNGSSASSTNTSRTAKAYVPGSANNSLKSNVAKTGISLSYGYTYNNVQVNVNTTDDLVLWQNKTISGSVNVNGYQPQHIRLMKYKDPYKGWNPVDDILIGGCDLTNGRFLFPVNLSQCKDSQGCLVNGSSDVYYSVDDLVRDPNNGAYDLIRYTAYLDQLNERPSLTAPIGNLTIHAYDTITFTASLPATSNINFTKGYAGTSLNISAVALYMDGVYMDFRVDPFFVYNMPLVFTNSGVHNLYVMAYPNLSAINQASNYPSLKSTSDRTITVLPAVVGNLAATTSVRNTALSWSASAGANNYTVYVVDANNQKKTYGPFTATSCSIFNLSVGNYNWYVVANGNDGTASTSPTAGFTIASLTPNPISPTNNTANIGFGSRVTFSWSSVPGASSYVLQYGFSGPVAGTTVTTGETSYTTVNGLAAGPYAWKIQAKFSDGTLSSPTAWQRFTVAPPAPVGLTVSGSGTASVTLSWTADRSGTIYNVYLDGNTSTAVYSGTNNSFTIRTPGSHTSWSVTETYNQNTAGYSGGAQFTATSTPAYYSAAFIVIP